MSYQITDEEVEELRQMEESLWRTDRRFDLKYMEKLLAPDFFEIGCSGKAYSREETLAMPKQEIDAVLPLSDFKARLVDKNAALVTYRSQFNFAGNIEVGQRCSLWSRVSGNWLLLFHQVTPA